MKGQSSLVVYVGFQGALNILADLERYEIILLYITETDKRMR